MILLDTDIAIDVLRRHPPAMAWISLVQDKVCLPGYVALELYQGCHDKIAVKGVEAELKKFAILWPSEGECRKVLAVYAMAHLSHSLGIIDALIAATAITHKFSLHTFNQKHFAAIPELKTIQPYAR